MYEATFGLKTSPFAMTPDPSTVYWTEGHREALAGLTYAIGRCKGIVVLSGPAGTGKTTLLRKFIDTGAVPMITSFIYNPMLSADDFLEMALADFGIHTEGQTKAQRLLRLEQFLLETHKSGKMAVLIIDEAHKLSPELLEEVRLFANFETDKQKLLQIVLAGQPELADMINSASLWQLKQRVALRLKIGPLAVSEVKQYLLVRWTKAGGQEPLPFDDAVVSAVGNASQGVPRIINGICDHALLSAYSSGRPRVLVADIVEALHDLDIQAPEPAAKPAPAVVNSFPNIAVQALATRTVASAGTRQVNAQRTGYERQAATATALAEPEQIRPVLRTLEPVPQQEFFLLRWLGIRWPRTGSAS